jgi:hypothetical protein
MKLDREITKKIVVGGIGIAFSIISHLAIKHGKVESRIDNFYDAREPKKED